AEYRKEIFKEYKPFRISELEFTPVPVVHSNSTPTVGFLIKEGGSVICYFPDFRSFVKEEDKKYFEEVDCLFLDGSMLNKPFPLWTNKWGHISIVDGIKLAAECKVRKVIFTHIGHKTMPHNELKEFLKGNGNICPAFDGMELQV
ncbi:MAG: MBL fold metallo-hydrolase, partial [Candidatus Jordarchaeaceae archaeon]